MKTTAQTPPLSARALQACLHRALAPTRLEVTDESMAHKGHAGAHPTGVGTHFRIRIASEKFVGLPRLQKHRLVYDALASYWPDGLHAVSIELL